MTIQANTIWWQRKEQEETTYKSGQEQTLPRFIENRHRDLQDILPQFAASAGNFGRHRNRELTLEPQKEQNEGINWQWVLDKSLVSIELLAVLAFGIVLMNFGGAVTNLNSEAVKLQERMLQNFDDAPAFTTTNSSLNVVPQPAALLDENAGNTITSINVESIERAEEVSIGEKENAGIANDPHILNAQTNAPQQTVPLLYKNTANNGVARRIRIPSLNVDKPIFQGDDPATLQLGVGQYSSSAAPGETGNIVLSAHNDIFGEIFRNLDELEPGDEIIISSMAASFTYIVREIKLVKPTEVWVLNPTDNPSTTLISCYPYLINNKRIVVFADLKET